MFKFNLLKLQLAKNNIKSYLLIEIVDKTKQRKLFTGLKFVGQA